MSYKTIIALLSYKSIDAILLFMETTVRKYKRKTPRPTTATFYLGDESNRVRRLAELDELAAEHGMSRSQLLQAIADRKIKLCKPQ